MERELSMSIFDSVMMVLNMLMAVQEYLEYQRQLALQRMHEQEMEMRRRLEQQKQEQQMRAMQYTYPQVMYVSHVSVHYPQVPCVSHMSVHLPTGNVCQPCVSTLTHRYCMSATCQYTYPQVPCATW